MGKTPPRPDRMLLKVYNISGSFPRPPKKKGVIIVVCVDSGAVESRINCWWENDLLKMEPIQAFFTGRFQVHGVGSRRKLGIFSTIKLISAATFCTHSHTNSGANAFIIFFFFARCRRWWKIPEVVTKPIKGRIWFSTEFLPPTCGRYLFFVRLLLRRRKLETVPLVMVSGGMFN